MHNAHLHIHFFLIQRLRNSFKANNEWLPVKSELVDAYIRRWYENDGRRKRTSWRRFIYETFCITGYDNVIDDSDVSNDIDDVEDDAESSTKTLATDSESKSKSDSSYLQTNSSISCQDNTILMTSVDISKFSASNNMAKVLDGSNVQSEQHVRLLEEDEDEEEENSDDDGINNNSKEGGGGNEQQNGHSS